jgi:hypothetical protein
MLSQSQERRAVLPLLEPPDFSPRIEKLTYLEEGDCRRVALGPPVAAAGQIRASVLEGFRAALASWRVVRGCCCHVNIVELLLMLKNETAGGEGKRGRPSDLVRALEHRRSKTTKRVICPCKCHQDLLPRHRSETLKP